MHSGLGAVVVVELAIAFILFKYVPDLATPDKLSNRFFLLFNLIMASFTLLGRQF